MEIREIKSQPTLSIRVNTPVEKLSQVFGEGYGKIAQLIQEKAYQFSGSPFAIYYNMDMQNLDVEFGFPVVKADEGKDDIKVSKLPEGKYAVNLYEGSYQGIEKGYDELTQWMKNNEYKQGIPCIEFYLNDPSQTASEELKTEIYFLIEE